VILTFSFSIMCVIWPKMNSDAMLPGSRRASDDPEEFEVAEKQTGDEAAMTEEQREYLRWYYRSEDRKCCCSVHKVS